MSIFSSLLKGVLKTGAKKIGVKKVAPVSEKILKEVTKKSLPKTSTVIKGAAVVTTAGVIGYSGYSVAQGIGNVVGNYTVPSSENLEARARVNEQDAYNDYIADLYAKKTAAFQPEAWGDLSQAGDISREPVGGAPVDYSGYILPIAVIGTVYFVFIHKKKRK